MFLQRGSHEPSSLILIFHQASSTDSLCQVICLPLLTQCWEWLKDNCVPRCLMKDWLYEWHQAPCITVVLMTDSWRYYVLQGLWCMTDIKQLTVSGGSTTVKMDTHYMTQPKWPSSSVNVKVNTGSDGWLIHGNTIYRIWGWLLNSISGQNNINMNTQKCIVCVCRKACQQYDKYRSKSFLTNTLKTLQVDHDFYKYSTGWSKHLKHHDIFHNNILMKIYPINVYWTK